MGGRGAKLNFSAGRPNEATEWYVSGEGMWVNQYFRGREGFGELTDEEKQMIKNLDTATDGKITDKTLFRSVDARAIFEGDGTASGFEMAYGTLKTIMMYGDNALGSGSYAQMLVDNAKKMLNDTVGKTITEKGYMSTTTDRSVAENWGDFTGSTYPVVMEIKTSKNTRGVDLSSYDRNVAPEDAQHERLLARGQKYTVKNVGIKNGNVYVYVEMK